VTETTETKTEIEIEEIMKEIESGDTTAEMTEVEDETVLILLKTEAQRDFTVRYRITHQKRLAKHMHW
jgi:hypothetical protein